MSVVSITHREDFSAAHRLFTPALDEDANRALYGPCYTLHGHNYGFEVTVAGDVDATSGMVMDLNVLMRVMNEEVIDHVEHVYLNEDVAFLEGLVPTAENLAIAFWDRVAPHLPETVRLQRVRVIESPSNRADYHGPEVRK